jgi:hypothetical protein
MKLRLIDILFNKFYLILNIKNIIMLFNFNIFVIYYWSWEKMVNLYWLDWESELNLLRWYEYETEYISLLTW